MENEDSAFSKMSETQILDKNYIREIITIPLSDVRERMLCQVESRARELKVLNNFKRLFKIVQADVVQEAKQGENSKETNFTRPPGGLKLKCKNYECNDFGIIKPEFDPILLKTKETLVCSHPILPVERLINIDTNTEKVKLAFYKDKKWQFVIAEKATLASKNKILQLSNPGIEVTENNAKELITYISDLLTINSETIPCNQAVTHLGWVENEFVPYNQNFKFDGDRSFEGIFKEVKTCGDFEVWKEEVYALRKSNETIRIMIAASFASVLIEKIHINPFIVHLWGKSGNGKTVTLMIAMSIWGNPHVGALVKNLNSTNVGLERLSAFLHNIPFGGDELQGIKNQYSDFSELIYQLTQGEGRSRGTVDGGIQEQLKWNCAFLTTGEEPITSETSKEGIKNRVIEIENNKDIVENGKATVEILFHNYGHAGREFIENLPSLDFIKSRHTKLFEELKKKNNSTGKQLNAIACILLADELASSYIFHDEPLTVDDMEKYFTKDIDEAERIYNLIYDYFITNINNFSSNKEFGEIWGMYDENQDGEITAFYFIPFVLRRFLKENNISFEGVKTKLADANYIETLNGKYSFPKYINKKTIRLIKFNILGVNKIKKEDLPF